MPHKTDRKRHRGTVRQKRRELKRQYMRLTKNDTVEPEKALATLKDAEQVEKVKRLAEKLARRGVYLRFHERR